MKRHWNKTLLCTALALVLSSLGHWPAAAVEVTIPDASLATCITGQLGLPAGTAVTTAQMASIASLSCFEAGIVSLTGAERLSRISKLSLHDSEIDDLTPLAGLTGLTSLELGGNRIANLVPLTRLTRLTALDLSDNQIGDIAPLAGLVTLAKLDLSKNRISSLGHVASLTNLQELSAASNRISDVRSLAGLLKLKQLYLANNEISDLKPLAALANLNSLALDNNRVSELAPLSRLSKLTALSASGNRIRTVTPLGGFKLLYSLNLARNQISTVAPLAGVELGTVDLSRNRFLDLSPLASSFPTNGQDFRADGQEIALPTARIGVPFPLLVKDDRGQRLPLALPAGVTYANGALTYSEPGSYRITFKLTCREDEGPNWTCFSGTITQSVPTWSVDRVAGSSRYATSAAVSRRAFPVPGVGVAYVATGAGFPDALAGGAAASFQGGPLLLVKLSSVPVEVKAELSRLKPKRIVVQGSRSVVSDAVVRQLKPYATTGQVTRNTGANRYDTAVVTSRNTWTTAENVILASAWNFPDALSGGSLFARAPGPVLLVPATGALPRQVSAEVARLAPKRVFLLGSTKVVSATVEAQLKAKGFEVIRLAGTDRYATSLVIAEHAYPGPGTADDVVVATGANFPDGLAAGPLAATRGGPLLLVNGTCFTAQAAAYLTKLAPKKMTLVGGPTVLGAGIEDFTICP